MDWLPCIEQYIHKLMKDDFFATSPWEPVDYLKTEEDIVTYLEAALETGDSKLISAVKEDIARTRGMASTDAC